MLPVRAWKLLSVCLVLLYSSTKIHAQGFKLTMLDSIQATDSSVWLNNDIKISNPSDRSLILFVEFNLPPFWELVGKKTVTVNIPARSSRVIPVNFLRRPQALAKWQPASIAFTDTISKAMHIKTFYLKSNPISRFSVTIDQEEFIISPDTKSVEIVSRITNGGNIDEDLTITSENQLIGVNGWVQKKLRPGETYIYNVRVRLTESIKKTLIKESIRIAAKNNAYLYRIETASATLHYTGKSAKLHKSSHPVIPAELETGVMYFSNTFAYYAGVRGSLDFKQGKKLNFSYRTKQLGLGNSVERNAFTLEYLTKRWRLYAGEMSELGSFYSFGKGFSFTRTSPKNTEINVSSVFHYKENPFKSDVFSTYVKYDLKKVVSLKHQLSVNNLPGQGRFAFALANEASYVAKSGMKLGIKVSAGEDHYMYDVPGAPQEKAGIAIGYSFSHRIKQLDIFSEYFKASNRFPGVFSGVKYQSHSAMLLFKKMNARVFYQYNYTRNNNILFIDSVYNTNFFDFDFEKFGLQLGFTMGKSSNLTVAGGQYRQTGNFGNFLPSAKFADIAYSYRKGRYFSLRLNSMNGYNSSVNAKGQSVWITRTTFMINTKFVGARTFYTRTPQRMSRTDSTIRVTETYSFGPFVKATLFKLLNADFSYNFSKSVYDKNMTTFAGMNITYTNKRNGLDIRLMGNVPITNTNKDFSSYANNSVVLNVRKMLNIPVVVKKIFYDLKVVLFNDQNNNGKFDTGDEPLHGVTVSISDRLFLTNSKGSVHYDNLAKNYYYLDLNSSQIPKGLIPRDGPLQFINVEKDLVYEVPFQKGMIISGNVKVTLDSLTEKTFTAERIKITVSDSLNNYFKTLANKKGDYYINVPPGKYRVSLNPEAFSKDLHPVKMFYDVEVGIGKEEAIVNFEIVEKKRVIRYLKK